MSKSVQVGPHPSLIGGTVTSAYTSRTITSVDSVLVSDDLLLMDTTTAGWNQPVPLSSTRTRPITLMKISADANSITVERTSPNLINGATTLSLANQNDFVTLAPVTGGYRIIAINGAGATPMVGDPPRIVTADDSTVPTDTGVWVDASGGNVTVTLDVGAMLYDITFGRLDTSANTAQVTCAGTDTIEGNAITPLLSAPYSFTIQKP